MSGLTGQASCSVRLPGQLPFSNKSRRPGDPMPPGRATGAATVMPGWQRFLAEARGDQRSDRTGTAKPALSKSARAAALARRRGARNRDAAEAPRSPGVIIPAQPRSSGWLSDRDEYARTSTYLGPCPVKRADLLELADLAVERIDCSRLSVIVSYCSACTGKRAVCPIAISTSSSI